MIKYGLVGVTYRYMNSRMSENDEEDDALVMSDVIPAEMEVRGCGLQTEPGPATLAPSSPPLELHRWPRCPRVNTYMKFNER